MFKQKNKFSRTAFTLVELLMALTISGIILAAVASLAFAFSSAYNASDETAEIQSRLSRQKNSQGSTRRIVSRL